MSRKSSTFYRIEKNIGDGFVSVFEFHTVVNGNRYIAEHEERNGRLGWINKNKSITKECGNKKYMDLLSQGYKLTGIYEMDVCGRKTKIKEV